MGASASTRITVAFDACSRATDVAAANAAAAAWTHARTQVSVRVRGACDRGLYVRPASAAVVFGGKREALHARSASSISSNDGQARLRTVRQCGRWRMSGEARGASVSSGCVWGAELRGKRLARPTRDRCVSVSGVSWRDLAVLQGVIHVRGIRCRSAEDAGSGSRFSLCNTPMNPRCLHRDTTSACNIHEYEYIARDACRRQQALEPLPVSTADIIVNRLRWARSRCVKAHPRLYSARDCACQS